MTRVALFGAPGSGKTTVARLLAKQLRCRTIEASKAVIYPLARQKSSSISREQALATFARLRHEHGADFVARTLHKLYVENARPKNLVFSGLRGLDNARYCRLHNDFVVFLKCDRATLIKRLQKDRGYTAAQAADELKREEKEFQTSQIEVVADLVIDTSKINSTKTITLIRKKLADWNRMCKTCVNTSKNPAISFDRRGVCSICNAYFKNFSAAHLKKEIALLKSFKGKGANGYDALIGVSGGKDSTATLYTLKQLGFNPLAVTFNLGYLPPTTVPRAKAMAALLKTNYEEIDIRHYVRPIDRRSYAKTAALYEEPFTLETKQKFKAVYHTGRQHYSVKCKHAVQFVRSCQICRRMVVRAYYGETLKRGTNILVLGINEWTNLSAAQSGRGYKVSGVRKLQPYKNKPPVYIFHLPFLLQRTSRQTRAILNKIGWTPPTGEDFIESNSNSCLFARSTERMAKRLLEFHPDSTRLAREVTVGFITKKQALKALGKIHPYKFTPRQVLQRARIL